MTDFIENFVSLTDNGLSTERFRRWSAICTVAALLNRNVWTSIRAGKPLFPNLYVLLVGPPASGKTQGMLVGRKLIETQEDVILAPDSGSYEMFINILAEGEKNRKRKSLEDASSIAIFLSEWGTFMRQPDNDFCAMMATVYDCDVYKHSVLWRGENLAENLYVTICACCTPQWFCEGFPPNSWDQGLPTRFQFIYDEAPDNATEYSFDEVGDRDFNDATTNALFGDACRISSARGFMQWHPESGKMLNDWRKENFNPVPVDPMLSGYAARRPLHVAKLATIMAVSSHPGLLTIMPDDFERARTVLLEAESVMHKALVMAGGNIYQGAIESMAAFVRARYISRGGQSVPEHEVRQHLARLVPPQLIAPIIGEMIASKRLKEMPGTKAPNRALKPG